MGSEKKWNLNRKLIIFISFCVIIGTIWINSLDRLEKRLMPTFIAMCEIEVKRIVNICIDDVITMLHDSSVYQPSDFYNVIYDKNGNVSLIENNSILINKITNDISYTLEDRLSEIGDIELELNIFDVLYPEAFDQFGPNYNMRILKDGYTDVGYKSEIIEISGNQTNFKAYVEIKVNVTILSPLYSEKIEIGRDVLIVDTIISSKNMGLKLNSD